MLDIRTVTDSFSVAPQIRPEDMGEIAARGFTLVINNRPEGEVPGQPSGAAIEQAARAAGLDYVHAPVVGAATPAQIETVHRAVQGAYGPVLAYCRSGTRSIITWARGQLQHGDRSPAELIELGAEAGYDLSGSLA